jgi:hypothetical protein
VKPRCIAVRIVRVFLGIMKFLVKSSFVLFANMFEPMKRLLLNCMFEALHSLSHAARAAMF